MGRSFPLRILQSTFQEPSKAKLRGPVRSLSMTYNVSQSSQDLRYGFEPNLVWDDFVRAPMNSVHSLQGVAAWWVDMPSSERGVAGPENSKLTQ